MRLGRNLRLLEKDWVIFRNKVIKKMLLSSADHSIFSKDLLKLSQPKDFSQISIFMPKEFDVDHKYLEVVKMSG